MYIPKRYGASKIDNCPFCSEHAIARNSQGIPVCNKHRNSVLGDLKCVCGDVLEPRVGKFGLYFFCFKCGNVNAKRALEMNDVKDASKSSQEKNSEVKKSSSDNQPKKSDACEVVRSDDPRYFD